MKNGFKHDIPLSFQIRPFKNFSISPAVTYSGVMYTQKIVKRWDPEFYDKNTDQYTPSVVKDTLRGIFYGQALNPSISASYNPQVFGTYTFRPESRLQSIRHVIKPSVGFSFIPKLEGLSSKMYRQVQVDTTGKNFSPLYSIYEGNIYGTPSLSQKSGNISFSLVNLVEAKIFAKNDTTGKPTKIKLIDNFGINTSYNIFADSLNWAPVSMAIRTTLLNNINISANSNFSLYGIDSNGRPIGTFAFSQNGKLMRLTNFSTSLDFSLSDLLKGKKDKTVPDKSQSAVNQRNSGLQGAPDQTSDAKKGPSDIVFDEFGYPVFNVPWSLRMSYSLSYTKTTTKPIISQTLSFNGNLTLTKRMSITYTSGYDFTGKKVTMTQIGVSRDLHCWEMNFNWVPNGSMQMWNFTIRVKASVLGDLKYERKKDFHDKF
jgi:hypothetical protein